MMSVEYEYTKKKICPKCGKVHEAETCKTAPKKESTTESERTLLTE
jgi:hypothetical protein